MQTIVLILQTISALPKIADLIKGVIACYLSWIDLREKERIDIAARELRLAKTPEEKRRALENWYNSVRH